MRTIAGYIKPYTARLFLQLCIKFSATILELLLPMMLSTILDDFVPAGNVPRIWLWGGLMIVCAGLAFAGNAINNRMATRVSADITRKLRYDLFSKVTRLSCAQVDGYSAPSLISRLTSDTYNLHQFIDRMQRLGVRAPILLIGGIIVTFTMEPVLTLVLLATLPILAVVVITVSKKGVPLYTKTQEALDGLVRKVQENMTGVRVIKALSKTEHEKLQFDAANREVTETERKAGLLMAVTGPVMNILLNFGLTGVIVVGAYRVHTGVTGSGTIIAFLSYFTIILMALMMVTRMFIMITKGTASANRIEEVLLSPEDMPQESVKATQSPYHIEFRGVAFSYNKVAFDVEDISFSLRRGQTLGIIGPTGSGKSTLLKLLLRFYDTDRGEILIDGRNVKSIPQAELHSMFGVVFQNDFLFTDSIRANIDFMRGLDDKAIEAASRDAQAAFITEREGGFAGRLTVKGSNLSGGQKQRLLIARALAAKNDILLLDDCSSALDYKTDSQLRVVLSRKRAGTSTVIVAQRISSIMNADHILVLDEGRVVGSGTHAELLMSCESYRDIYRVQMGEAV